MWFLETFKTLPRFTCFSLAFAAGWVISLGDALSRRVLRLDKRSRYLKEGACSQSGNCCQAIGIKIPPTCLKMQRLIWLFNKYQKWVYDFNFEGIGQNGLLVYSCPHLSRRRCTIYPFRPWLCREYPFLTLLGRSSVHQECGFSFRLRGASAFETCLTERLEKKKSDTFFI